MPLSVSELQPALQDLFTRTAEEIAKDTGFCRRRRKLTGPVFAQTLVFSLLDNPDCTLEELADNASDYLDVDVSPQAFDKRFTEPAACFFQDLLLDAFSRSFDSAHPSVLPLLRRFKGGVHVRDATSVTLPACLAPCFPGCGGAASADGASAVKLVFSLDVTRGTLDALSILAGKDNEKTAEVAHAPLPEGALLLEDMGFFSGERLEHYARQGVYFLTRVPVGTVIFEEKGGRLDLAKLLRQASGWRLELPVRLIAGRMLPCRLLAVRLPEEEVEKRRRKVREEARQKGRRPNEGKLEMCEWNVLVTNAPVEMLSAEEACVARRVRWQVELLFKVFKSEGEIDESKSEKPWRVLCELYAKLLGMLVQQWLLLAAGFRILRHSGRKAARQVKDLASGLVEGIRCPGLLSGLVRRLSRRLHRRCSLEFRLSRPSTLDRLSALDPRIPGLRKTA